MSSASVQSRDSKPPEGRRTSTRGTDSSTSSCRLSKEQNAGSLRESISSFPSERSSNVANQTTYSTRSCSQDNIPHSSTTSVSRSSTSRFASETLASKTRSSISGLFIGQPTEPSVEKHQASTSEHVNASNFVDTRTRRASNIPLTVSSSDCLEISPTKNCANKEGSRIPSENLTDDQLKTVSLSEEGNNAYMDNGKARFVKKSTEAPVILNKEGTLGKKELKSTLKESSSCSSRLVPIPFGSVPIDIVVGCGINRDNGFLNRTESVASIPPGAIAYSSLNRQPSIPESSISNSRSSTSSSSEGPFRGRIYLAAEIDSINADIKVARSPSQVTNISSCTRHSVENSCPEDVPQHDIPLRAPASECSVNMDDSVNTSSISNIHLSVSQMNVSSRKPLLHMTISSNSDVEFLFNRTPSETSTRTELSIVVKIPGSGPQTEEPVHINSDNGSSEEQCRATNIHKLFPVVNTDESDNGSRSMGFPSIDTQLSIGDSGRPSLDVSGDDESGVRRYVLRCHDRMVPLASDPATQQMAFVCTIEEKQCQVTGENEDITCVSESEMQLPETLQKEIQSLAVLKEDNSGSERMTGCCSASLSHASSVSEHTGSHLQFVGASPNSATHTDKQNRGSPSESILPRNDRNSLRKARTYFKELCSRYGYCSSSEMPISDAQQPSGSFTSKEKSDHRDAKPKTKVRLLSLRYLTDCPSEPSKLSTEFSNIRNSGTKTDEVLCCKPSAEDDLEQSVQCLEEKDDGLTVKVSEESAQNLKSSQSFRGKSDSDSSDGSIKLSGVPDAKSKTCALLVKLTVSISGSSLGSVTDGNIETNAEDIKTQTGFMNLLAEEIKSPGLEMTAKSHTGAFISVTPVDSHNLGIPPPENCKQIDTKIDSSFHTMPNPDIPTELIESPPNQPFLSEKHLSKEDPTRPFPLQSESTSSSKLLENSEQLPVGNVKDSYTGDRGQLDVASSVTRHIETDSGTGHHLTSSDFDSRFHADNQNEMDDYSDGHSQDERQIYPNNDQGVSSGFKNANQQRANNRNIQLHNRKYQPEHIKDSLVAAQNPARTTPKDNLTEVNRDLEFPQRSHRKSTSIRTHPNLKVLNQSLHPQMEPLHVDCHSHNYNRASAERVTTYDDYSSEGLESNTALTSRSDEYGDRVVQMQNTKEMVRDNCGCKSKPKQGRNKPYNSGRKNRPAREHASHVENECMTEHKEVVRKLKRDIERKRIHGTDKKVTDDNVDSAPESKRLKRITKQRIRDYNFSLRNLRKRTDDNCGCTNAISERCDEGGFQQKEELYIFSDSVRTATDFAQHNTTSSSLECIEWSSLDKLSGFAEFGRESNYKAKDCYPKIEAELNSGVVDRKLNKRENRDHVRERRHKRKQNVRILEAKPEEDDCNKSESIISISCSYKATDQESMGFQSRKGDIDRDNDRSLNTGNKEKSRIGFCRDLEVEVRKTSVVHKTEQKLDASPSHPIHSNREEADRDSERQDALYFDRLQKEFELVSAHQRKLDEFSLLGPECAALLRELDAKKLRDIGLKTKMSHPVTHTRHHSKFSNQESVATLEDKTDHDLCHRNFSGGIDGREYEKGMLPDATKNETLPCTDVYKDKFERKGRRRDKRRNRIRTSGQCDGFSNDHHKFSNKLNCNCEDLENGSFSFPCDEEDSAQKLPNCPDWTTGRGALTFEEVESNSYLETWIERNIEPIASVECVDIKDTPFDECSIIPTCDRRICSITEFEMDAEEENMCSYLSSAILNHEITLREYGRKDSSSEKQHETDSQPRSQCGQPYDERGKPCHQLQYRMTDVASAAVDSGTLTENTISIQYGFKDEHDQVKKKQRKTKIKRKASNAFSCELDENIPELPELSDREPAQPEEVHHKLDQNKDGTQSKNEYEIKSKKEDDTKSKDEECIDSKSDEDKDKSRGKRNKFSSTADDKYTSDKNDASPSAVAIQVSNFVQIPVEADQLPPTDETNDENDESAVQMNQQNGARTDNEGNKALASEKQVEMDDANQDATKSSITAPNDGNIGNTDNVLSTETDSEMPISHHVADDIPPKETDENSAVDRENHLAGEEETQVHNSLIYNRSPVEEPANVTGSIALSYLDNGEVKGNSVTVERKDGNLNSVRTPAEADTKLPERNVDVVQTARSDSMPNGNSEISVNLVDRSKLMMGSEQKDQKGSRNSLELSSVQPTGTDKGNSVAVTTTLLTQNVDASTDDSSFKRTDEENLRAGSNDIVLTQLERLSKRLMSLSKEVPSSSTKRTVDETSVPESKSPDPAYGSRSLEEHRPPSNIFRWPQSLVIDRNSMAGSSSLQDRHGRHALFDESPDATKGKLNREKKFGLSATQDRPRDLENKPLSLLSPMESFQKMLRNGVVSKNKNKNLMFRRYGDSELADQSRRHSSGQMILSEASISDVVNHRDPDSTGINWTENETPGSDPERLLDVTDYSKLDLNVEVPLEEPTPDEEDRTWEREACLKGRTEEEGSGPYEKYAEASKEDRRQEEMKTDGFEMAEGHVAGIEPSTPEYPTLRELDSVSRQLLRCRRESEKLMKDKSLIQLKLLRLKEPQTPAENAKSGVKALQKEEEKEEEEEEEEEKDAQQLGFYRQQNSGATVPTFPLDQLEELRRRLDICQKAKESTQRQKEAAQMELDRMLQSLPDMPQQSLQWKKRSTLTGQKNGNQDAEVKGQTNEDVNTNPVVVRRPYYYTMMMVTESGTCSRQFYSQVKSLLSKLRKERSDFSCGDDDFKDRMLWILWHQRQEAFRELGEWERLLRRMNIPAGTVRESLRQLERQMDDQIAEIDDYKNELSQLRIQKMRMEQTMSEHIRLLVEDRWKHAVLVKTLRQRNDFLTAEGQSEKRADESKETSSHLRDREEIQSLRTEIRRPVPRLTVTDDCFAQRCPIKALSDSRSQSDDRKNTPEDDGFNFKTESSPKKFERRAESTSRRLGTTEDVEKRKLEEDLNEERTKWLREKDDLEKKLKFRDKIIDELTTNAKDRRGRPSFQLTDSARSKEQTTAANKPNKNSNRTEHRLQFKTPFNSRFNSAVQFDQYERNKGEKQTTMNGGWSSPLLTSDPPQLVKRYYEQKQLRASLQNCGSLTQRHLVNDSAKASKLFDGSRKDLSLVDLDRDVESEYESLLGQRHRSDLVTTSSTPSQLNEIVRRMEKLEALVNGQHLLLTFTRARMASLDDDNEFLRQQLAALRRRTFCDPETDR